MSLSGVNLSIIIILNFCLSIINSRIVLIGDICPGIVNLRVQRIVVIGHCRSAGNVRQLNRRRRTRLRILYR